MTSKVNEKTEILTPCRSETPESIEVKIGVNDYVMDPYNLASFFGNRSNGVCSPYCWNITYLCLCVTFPFLPVFTARCTLVQSAVLRSHVVCPSVCPSVCDVGGSGSHRSEMCKARYCDRMSSVRLSVRLSVTLVDQDHIGRKYWKLIARTLSPTPSLFGAKGSYTYSQGNMGKFWGD